MLFVEADDLVAEVQAMLDHMKEPLEAVLGAFEPEGVAAAESLSERPSSGELPRMPCSIPGVW